MKILFENKWEEKYQKLRIHGTKELRTWGNEDIATLASYYEETSTLPMKKNNCPYNSDHFFNKEYSRENRGRKISKYIKRILNENSDDIKGITWSLTIMMAASKAGCKQGFSCKNSQKNRSWQNSPKFF